MVGGHRVTQSYQTTKYQYIIIRLRITTTIKKKMTKFKLINKIVCRLNKLFLGVFLFARGR